MNVRAVNLIFRFCQVNKFSLMIKVTDIEDEEETYEDSLGKSKKRTEYNTLEIPNVALQSIRYGVGLRATAAITTAALMDAGLITEGDKRLVVDHSKVRRAQEKIMKSLYEKFDELCEKGEISCIFFDGRIDATKVMLKADNSAQQFPSIIREEHYAVCSEPGERYLYHFTPEKGSKSVRPA